MSTEARYVEKRGIAFAFALRLVDGAVAEARRIGGAFSITVVDESGNPTAFVRMDGAGPGSAQMSRDKAYTVIATGMTPTQWFEYSQADPKMAAGMAGMERVVTFDGGLPIVVDDEVIGALGVSGGHYEQDLKVATAALEAVRDDGAV